MSLLLDALKKAADDKKKLSQGESTASVSSDGVSPEVGSSELTLESTTEAGEELTLDPFEKENRVEVHEALELTAEVKEIDSEADASNSKPADDSDDSNTTSYTVSDEALSMLIYKTNRDVKKEQAISFHQCDAGQPGHYCFWWRLLLHGHAGRDCDPGA